MEIGLFMPVWNEAFSLGAVLDYYNRNGIEYHDMHIYDTGSTDGSQKIASSRGCNVITSKSGLDDRNYLDIKNEEWKSKKAFYDWVICCDADELLYFPGKTVKEMLIHASLTEHTIIAPLGFDCYGNGIPDPQDPLNGLKGFYNPSFDKPVAFDCHAIHSINFAFGAHSCRPSGIVKRLNQGYLVHIRCLGGVRRKIDRHKEYTKRMSDFNKANGLGVHYFRSEEELKQEWEQAMKRVFSIKMLV